MALPTLLDYNRLTTADGKIAKVIELAEPTNEILQDIPWKECNQVTSHKTTVATGYPAGTWRKLNYGVQPEVPTHKTVVDTTGMLEGYSEVDKSLAMLNGNTAEFRLSQDRSTIIGLNKTFNTTLIYGDTSGTTPEKFMGLAPRFVIPSTDSTLSGYNMIDGGAADGQTDCTSIWLVCWGEETVHGIYPKGSQMGLSVTDLGEDTLSDAAGGKYQGYRTHYKWDCGLTVRDWRYVVRICNIDTSALTRDAASGAKLIELMTSATERVADLNMGKPAFYCNRTIKSYLRNQMVNKAAYNLNFDTVAGKHVLSFDGIPVRRVDAITNTETAILDAAGSFAAL